MVLLCLMLGLMGTACGKSTPKVEPLALEDPGIFVEAIPSLPEDFVLGADVSSLLSQEASGVVYYDETGAVADPLLTLARNGVNTVRIRVWNQPYELLEGGEKAYYGGGNNDIEAAVILGKRATAYGMGVMVDFHYSDFWADPNKQMTPKAWKGMSREEKGEAAYTYTKESLKALLDAGVDVTLVQIGNEINNGLSGEDKWSSRVHILSGGSRAIREISREYEKEIGIVVHFTNPETTGNFEKYAQMLKKFQVDYDIFATSYYPFWHGSCEHLTQELSKIATNYGKKVMVAEISWTYTNEDGDGFGNSISSDSTVDWRYPVSVQGQVNAIRDAVSAVVACGDAGIGLCYWDPAWIPVPGETLEERQLLWETYGSGWASSASASYDPEDAGKYYGGSSWDNQALFDFTGHPLDSIHVFNYLKSGATTTRQVDEWETPTVKVRLGDEIDLPQTVVALYNDQTTEDVNVVWDAASLAKISSDTLGEYVIQGKASKEVEVKCILQIVEQNYVENPSFEEEDCSMWILDNIENSTGELFVSEKSVDAVDGEKSMHFYSTSDFAFTMEQTVTGLPTDRTYHYSLGLHGGSAPTQEITLYAIADGVEYEIPASITSWQEVTHPSIEGITTSSGEITIGIRVKANGGAWGNLDDVLLAPNP